jgi:glucose/arabinose dehydrogenase
VKKAGFRYAVIALLALAAAALFVWPRWQGLRPVLLPSRGVTEQPLPAGIPPVFAEGLGGPRVLALDPRGTLVVSIPERGQIVALPDKDNNGVADETVILISGLERPHGLAFACNGVCQLFVATVEEVLAYPYDAVTLTVHAPERVTTLPSGGRHSTRTLLFHEGELLVSIGSSCDVCVEEDPRHGSVQVVHLDSGTVRPFATGLRNAVFLTHHPLTGEVWATEMGRDNLGDTLPPDEINVLQEGNNYGWPLCYGQRVPDLEFKSGGTQCERTVPSHIDLPAHSAPLGLTFVPHTFAWPEELRGTLLVAYHGSWNRSEPTGYKVVRFPVARDGTIGEGQDFLTGWLEQNGTAFGRPVDLVATPEGVLYISDDKAGVIYRLQQLP